MTCTPEVAGTESSPTGTPICCSMNFSDFMSDCAALKSFVASWLTTLVSAGDADSTGNGSTGAFGNASSATAVTVTGAEVVIGAGRETGGGAGAAAGAG